jgi:HSP20 family molecular chaperone IbpA
MDDLDVEIEHNQLIIRGKQGEDESRVYLHRGIAARQFQRSFVLADGIEVRGAALDNGLLHVELERVVPESAARKIEIQGAEKGRELPQAIDLEPSDSSGKKPGKRK